MNCNKFVFSFSILCFIFLSISCRKQGCTDNRAINYDLEAKKDDGSCIYAMEPDTLCEDSCQNGGTCVGGECECPPEYTGEFCEEYAVPSEIIITKAIVRDYDVYDGNGDFLYFDEYGCEDFPEFFLKGSRGLDSWTMRDNTNPFPPLQINLFSWDNGFGDFKIKEFQVQDTVYLMDSDHVYHSSNCKSDILGMVQGFFYNKQNPDTVQFYNPQRDSLKVTFFLEYEFDSVK